MPRGRRPEQSIAKTVGGQKLRAIREAGGKSLLELAATIQNDLGMSVDAGHINKIEIGRIKGPQARTLTAILDALQVSYSDRRAVLEAFGYNVPMTLPT